MNGEALFLRSGETCLDGPLNILGDELIVKVGAKSSAMTIMLSTIPPMAGPPLHRHSREDEAFFVLQGDYLFESDGKQNRVGPGGFVFLPRGTAHTFQNLAETTGRVLIISQPAGIEEFFSKVDRATRGMKQVNMDVVLPIFAQYGIEFLGPPIGARTNA
jgi:quercetin dioxygenase-like cupin family protein